MHALQFMLTLTGSSLRPCSLLAVRLSWLREEELLPGAGCAAMVMFHLIDNTQEGQQQVTSMCV